MKEATCGACGITFIHNQRRRQTCDDCKRRTHNEYNKRHDATHREAARARRRRWVDANPETMRQARRSWKAAHPEEVQIARREQRSRHPEKNRSYVAAYKARRAASQVIHYTAEQLRLRWAYYGGCCWVCGVPATTTDHIKPLSKGGAHMLCNLRPACQWCNTAKHDHWPFDVQAFRLRPQFLRRHSA